jgi:hypothetical protein
MFCRRIARQFGADALSNICRNNSTNCDGKSIANSVVLTNWNPGAPETGYQFVMGYENTVAADRDVKSDQNGVPILIDRDCAGLLSGTQIVFGEQDGKPGFIFHNPAFRFPDSDPLPA